jgi:DNA oxidative demethylase
MTSYLDDLFPLELMPCREAIGEQAFVLRGFALPHANELIACVAELDRLAPFRQMVTPGGFTMSVAMTNCGRLGWTTDRRGYRYSERDPVSGEPWPAMPELFLTLARRAAAQAGFEKFTPDACLVNRYRPGSRLSLHQDKNEQDYDAPIVSVSLGIPATFLFGGYERSDKVSRIPLHHGDVTVWGGQDRLRYHGVLPVKSNPHPMVGDERINFTFRKAG